MEFIETTVFTEQINNQFEDDEYINIQNFMIKRPDAGDIIPGGGGIRKLRWSTDSKGKRGGVRLIYYWQVSEDIFYMLLMYPKGKQKDLTSEQLKRLSLLAKSEFD